jgi:hypothetical protein
MQLDLTFMQQNPEQLQSLADSINTGLDNPETSRALIVFNQTDQAQSGITIFRASMSWPRNQPLPPVAVMNGEGSLVSAAIGEMSEAPDPKGRADRLLLSLALRFEVTNVPPLGWRTYYASYAEHASPPLENAAENTDLIVIETTRHGGDLPTTGNF